MSLITDVGDSPGRRGAGGEPPPGAHPGPGRTAVFRRLWGGKVGSRQPFAGYLLLSPALMLYLAFIGIPLVGIVIIAFVQWDLISAPTGWGWPTSGQWPTTISSATRCSTRSCST